MTKIALLGAGGKMGVRLATNLSGSRFTVDHVEVSEPGRARLKEAIGAECVDTRAALDGAEVVVLAVPDNLIGRITRSIESELAAGTMVVALDAAAPYAGEMPERPDLTYFIAHPCHPPIFNDETDPEAKADHFGGVKAKQHIVCALMQGPEAHYALGEEVARTIYAPVMRSHRVTLEGLALLEPALSETIGATCVKVVREAVDEVVKRGVPEQAAIDFILGHLNIEIAILFGALPGGRFSDGALKAIDRAKRDVFQPDWRKVFEPDALMASIRHITEG